MNKLITFLTILCLALPVYAELAPGENIEDYLPIITGDTLTDPATGFVYQVEYTDEFEVEATKFKWKGELKLMDTPTGVITMEELEFDADPMVFLNYLIYNPSASTQTYQVNIIQPAIPFPAPSQMYGSVTVNLLDTSTVQNGATLTDAGTDLYKAFIDTSYAGDGSLTGVPVIPLLSPAYTLTTPGATQTTATDEAESGWLVNGIPVTTNLGIQLEFTLSPGDSASVLSRFEVIAIPEPATMVLLGLGGLLLRRRK